jgi:hypothetical protein
MKLSEIYEILKEIDDMGKLGMNSGDFGIDDYWQLVREDYLKSLVGFGFDWYFKLSKKGEEFLEEINKIQQGRE